MPKAKTDDVKPDFVDDDAVESAEIDHSVTSVTPDGWEFEIVAEETPTKVVFETIGDVFIGQYVGPEHVDQEPDPKTGEDKSFDLYIFRGRNGGLYAINKGFKLAEAMETVGVDEWVRFTYVKDVPTGRKQNPMKDLRVERRK